MNSDNHAGFEIIIAKTTTASGATIIGQWNTAGLGQVLVNGIVWEHTQGRTELLAAWHRAVEEQTP